MPSSKTSPTLTEPQFGRLRTIIYDRSGIHFPDNKKYVLESRLGHRLTELELDDFDQYIAFLTMGPYQADEFQEMFNRITINETSFFRNEPQLEVFEKTVLPGLLERRSSAKRIRIWSAACSSGEEPYTLAMLLHRSLGVRLADWRIEILGTDISEKCLDIAQAGRYSGYALRSTSELTKKRYFRPEGVFFDLDPTIKSMVSFERHNLKDTLAAKRHGTWDVIFCRNVMIYFDDPMKKLVVRSFYEQLAADGALFIGHSESLRGLDVPFVQMPVPQAFCYTKT
jgi:chemotaxis protein methyltransferase CheR